MSVASRRSTQRKDDDRKMRLRAGYRHWILVGVLAIAIAVMGVASFMPFLQTPCGGCLDTPTYTLQLSRELAQAPDAWIVIATLLLLAIAATLHVARIRPALTALACLGLSVVALGFPFAEVSNNGSLVFPGATAINPMTTEAGFSVFLGGAALACLAATLLVVASLRRDDGQARNHSEPGPLGVPLVP